MEGTSRTNSADSRSQDRGPFTNYWYGHTSTFKLKATGRPSFDAGMNFQLYWPLPLSQTAFCAWVALAIQIRPNRIAAAAARCRRRIEQNIFVVLWDSIAWQEQQSERLLRFTYTLPVYTQRNSIVDQ
jgi:hypothetical protein